MNAYEAKRLENIKRNKALIQELGISQSKTKDILKSSSRGAAAAGTAAVATSNSNKRRRINAQAPTRASARIASKPTKSYNSLDERSPELTGRKGASRKRTSTSRKSNRNGAVNTYEQEPVAVTSPGTTTSSILPNIAVLQASWSSWVAVAGAPTRDPVSFSFQFESHPTFTPNKSPEEMLREGCFGGAYFRPLFSRALGITVADDWKELPASWLSGLRVDRFVASSEYNADVNKFKVSCGQSIEEWEAAGWIDHEHDVRGWFQWYCRFFIGRRCDDDERQVSRWRKCVGETGRWRRMLLKKYVALGVRHVFDDGDDDGDDGPAEVSPVMHQTCHHWAFEVRQDILDHFWKTGT